MAEACEWTEVRSERQRGNWREAETDDIDDSITRKGVGRVGEERLSKWVKRKNPRACRMAGKRGEGGHRDDALLPVLQACRVSKRLSCDDDGQWTRGGEGERERAQAGR